MKRRALQTKRAVVAVVVAVVGLIGLWIYLSTSVPPVFHLYGTSATDFNGTPTLQVNFDVDSEVKIALINPDGFKTGETTVSPEEMATRIPMDEQYTTPKAGSWNLMVHDSSGNRVYENVLEFTAMQITISEITPKWENYEYLDYWSLVGIEWRWNWSGDLPVYTSKIRVCVDDEFTDFAYSEVFFSGGSRSVDEEGAFHSISHIQEGVHQLKMELYDESGNLVAYRSEETETRIGE